MNLIKARQQLITYLEGADGMLSVLKKPSSPIKITACKPGRYFNNVPNIVDRLFSEPTPKGSVTGQATQSTGTTASADVTSTVQESVGIHIWRVRMSVQEEANPLVDVNLVVTQMRARAMLAAIPVASSALNVYPSSVASQFRDSEQSYKFSFDNTGAIGEMFLVNCAQQADNNDLILDPAFVLGPASAVTGYNNPVPASFAFSNIASGASLTAPIDAVIPGTEAFDSFLECLDTLTRKQ